MLEELIRELWGEAERLHLPVVTHGNPGATVEFLEQVFGRPVPSHVATWFSWRDGVAYLPGQTQNDAALVPGYEPLSATESAAMRRDSPRDPLLLSNFFPLLGTGGGDFYAASYDLETARSHVVSVVVGEDSRVAYGSIEQMVETLVGCYRDGIFFVDEDGVLQADDERWIQREIEAVGRISDQ
ncbi:hypothetical protein [Streptomyces sp. SID13726]|uniref:hypothetical protein n=1 Tax=Streptomyces sp. SID13726 TaxID=2706058 RepID=UPI0013B7DC42|nr:hypothetical protein [Streptomyces sp. SID13726]NEA99699.1 hypothetical protein [Streptomyces sp. SID13726]